VKKSLGILDTSSLFVSLRFTATYLVQAEWSCKRLVVANNPVSNGCSNSKAVKLELEPDPRQYSMIAAGTRAGATKFAWWSQSRSQKFEFRFNTPGLGESELTLRGASVGFRLRT